MKLYKYSAVDENCLSGLINSQLWFSDPRSFNDPFDSNLDNYYEEQRINEIDFMTMINDAMKKIYIDIKDAQAANQLDLILRSNERKEELIEMKQKFINAENFTSYDTLGVLCLTKNKGESNTLMWSHYGNSHKGVMLEFKTDEDTNFFMQLNSLSIEYTNVSNGKYCEVVKGRLKELFKKIAVLSPNHKDLEKQVMELLFLLLVKAKQWEYEQEERLIKMYIKNNQRLFKYDPHCLTGIYFGLNTTEEHKQTIKHIIQLKGLTDTKLYQAEKVEDSFNLVYTEI